MSKKLETAVEEKVEEKPFEFHSFELKTLEDYDTWNMHARKAFIEAKKLNPKADPPIKVRVPDESFHKKAKIKFQRFDQPENVLKACLRTKHIQWEGQLKPGKTYELPLPVIKFLNSLATPIFAEVKVSEDGEVRTETQQVGEKSRFSCQLVDF